MAVINTITRIRERYNEAILDATEFADCYTLHIRGEKNLDILTTLKEDEEFNFLAGLTAVDNLHLGGFERFAIVYHLLSHKKKERLTVKAYVSEEKLKLSSVESLWKTADWQEREVYDLFGIEFENHPNLIRIMNPEDYKGHPLRKDYPRQGRGERKDFLVVERGIGSKFSRK